MENEGNPSKTPAVNVDRDEDQREEEEELTVTDSGVVVTEKRDVGSSIKKLISEAKLEKCPNCSSALWIGFACQMIEGCPPFLNRKEIEVAKAYVDNERPPFQAPVKHFSCGMQHMTALGALHRTAEEKAAKTLRERIRTRSKVCKNHRVGKNGG
uniref:Uncharacterized protein n=1 Tax=Phtheirospermum japonicum TaxID=374723 RepID=A0A830CA23_9LAMI